MRYKQATGKDYGVNACDGCLAKQRVIDRQCEEIIQLKQKLRAHERKVKEGFLGSSTPSSQVPVKANSLAEKQAQKGGAKVGHKGVGRQVFTATEADEVRVAEVAAESCEVCECQLIGHSANARAIDEVQREEVRKVYYEIERKRCPNCRKILAGNVTTAMPQAKLSNELVVAVAEQHYVLGRTLGQIAERCAINDATLSQSLQRMGQPLAPGLEQLKAADRHALVRHADETSWRTDGGNGYSW